METIKLQAFQRFLKLKEHKHAFFLENADLF